MRKLLDELAWSIIPLTFLTLVSCVVSLIGVEVKWYWVLLWLSFCIIVWRISDKIFNKVICKHHIQIKFFDKENFYQLMPERKGDLIDLRAAEDVEMKAFEFMLIPLGVAMKLPDGYKANLYPRSSTYKNFGIIMANSVGQVDSGYCGSQDQWMFPAIALRDTVIHKGERICQFEIVPIMDSVCFDVVDDLVYENRGGIGSTGTK